MAQLAVGDVRRPTYGRLIKTTALLGVAFTAVTWLGKEYSPLYAASPWAEDPYDAFVSFAIFFVPLLTGLLVIRLPQCRRNEPVVATRLADLVRTSNVLIAVVAVTLTAEWIALAATPAPVLSTASAVDVAMLVGLTATTAVCAWMALTVPALTDVLASREDAAAADALGDGVATARLIASRLGDLERRSTRLLDLVERLVVAPTRSHPTTAAALASLVFGSMLAASAALEEGLAQVLAMYFFVGTCAMFAFLMIGGAYLHVVRPTARLSGWRVRARAGLIVGAAAAPVALAFRDVVWSFLGVRVAGTGVSTLEVLVIAAALIGFVVGAVLARPSGKR